MSAAPRLRTRRLAGAAAAVALALAAAAPGVPAAAAPGDPTRFEPDLCTASQPSPASAVRTPAWQAERLRFTDLHRIATGRGVTVAVIDTGVGTDLMPALRETDIEIIDEIGAQGINKGRFDCQHGSIVTSILAAAPGAVPDSTFSGIAPGVRVLSYRALATTKPPANSPNQPLGPVIEAIDDAVDREVDIISISQQGDATATYRRAIQRAVDAGILVVAAAGNDGPSGPTYPAAYPGVMAVAMTDRADQVAEQSQYGEGMTISVAAPGVALMANLPTCEEGSSGCKTERDDQPSVVASDDTTGTSFATPLVAGAAALLMERYPDLTAQQVRQRLEETADPPPGGGVDVRMGHGIINPYRALTGPMMQAPGSVEPTTVTNQRVDPPPGPGDTSVRDTGLIIAGSAVGLAAVGAVVVAALPAGRRRGWRPAR